MAGKRSENKALVRSDFTALLADVKSRIQAAQTRAVLSVNAELVRLYWDIGQIIDERQQREGWGAAVIPRLARELHNELPELKGFPSGISSRWLPSTVSTVTPRQLCNSLLHNCRRSQFCHRRWQNWQPAESCRRLP